MSNLNQEKSSQQPNTDPFSLLNDTQWRFVTAMIENPAFNKKDAAEYIGIKPDTTYAWTSRNPYVDQAVELGRKDIHAAALARRKQAVLKAIAVKVSLLDSDDESIRSKAATELIEWELGKATQTTDHTSGGEKLTFEIRYAKDDTD